MGIDSLRRRYPWPSKPEVPGDDHSLFCNHSQVAKLLSADMRLIVELGSWLGSSTRFILDHAPNAVVLAIDHWKGSDYHLDRDYAKRRLPMLYETFLVNCWDYRDRLVPMRTTTVEGLLEVHALGLIPDFIYVDADHEYESVTLDLQLCVECFPTTRIVGDDWNWGEDLPVRRAALEFASKRGITVVAEGNCWWFA